MKRPLLIPVATVFAVAVVLGVVPHRAAADVVPSTEKPRIEAKRCSVGKGRLSNIADTLKVVSDRRATTYTNAYERTSARVAVLQQKGYDSSKLESDLRTLNQQISDYRAKTEQLHANLTSAKELACGDSDGAYTTALASTRTQLAAVRESAQAIHKTLRDGIATDLKAAAAWTKNN